MGSSGDTALKWTDNDAFPAYRASRSPAPLPCELNSAGPLRRLYWGADGLVSRRVGTTSRSTYSTHRATWRNGWMLPATSFRATYTTVRPVAGGEPEQRSGGLLRPVGLLHRSLHRLHTLYLPLVRPSDRALADPRPHRVRGRDKPVRVCGREPGGGGGSVGVMVALAENLYRQWECSG